MGLGIALCAFVQPDCGSRPFLFYLWILDRICSCGCHHMADREHMATADTLKDE